jgi:hypothetical protein
MSGLNAFMLSFFNGVLLVAIVYAELNQFMSVFMLYAACALYFVVVPLLLDSFSLVFGLSGHWEQMISTDAVNYPYHLDGPVLARVAIFLTLFNLLAVLTFYTLSRNRRVETSHVIARRIVKQRNLQLGATVMASLGWVGFLLFVVSHGFAWSSRGFGYLERMGTSVGQFSVFFEVGSRSLLALSGVAIFIYALNKRYAALMITLLPSLLILLLTTERPYFVPSACCAAYGLLYSSQLKRQDALAKFVLAILIAYLIPQIFNIVRPDVGSKDFAIPYPISRDSSVNNLYYTFDDVGMYGDRGTEFSNIRRLITTGVLPSSVFGSGSDNYPADATRYIAHVRFAAPDNSTLHPSMYGWLYIDMKWYGVLFGVAVGLIAGIQNRFAMTDFVRIALFSLWSVFIVVGMRGSVQFGYASSIWGLWTFMILYKAIGFLEESIDSRPNKQRWRSAVKQHPRITESLRRRLTSCSTER